MSEHGTWHFDRITQDDNGRFGEVWKNNVTEEEVVTWFPKKER